MTLHAADLETSIQGLLQQAELELAEQKIRSERQEKLAQTSEALTVKFNDWLGKIDSSLAEYERQAINSSAQKQLQEQRTCLLENLAHVETLAAEAVDEEFFQKEEALIERQFSQEMDRWRQQLKGNLIRTIRDQQNFFDATDVALVVRDYLADLSAIGALPEITQALVNQINDLSTKGVTARHVGTDEGTVRLIADKALENRQRSDRGPLPRQPHRQILNRPNLYHDLSGLVVIAGGHTRLEVHIRDRLKESKVRIVWAVNNAGVAQFQSAATATGKADLVLIIAGYAGHSMTELVMTAAKAAGSPAQKVLTTGMTGILEAIAIGLRTKHLMAKLNTRKRA